ncbi:hypothetical protein [Flavobacterium sedimenticola]|uniref:DUF4468 domain-containing protein n=1 Tax=Flavobacterium sedimenticola TaxID=3043286 RepID=A0ABT6XMP9_9FLAO|nr:hypothetical protein [Flavobacterium sedimenticola]MDI9256363.1 hypothetical protein [Flavobacterium sedimenticola]
MKKIIALLMICSSSLAQDKFSYDSNTITDFIVIDTPGASSDIYKKAVNWIKENYVNPDDVILMQMENEKIRFQGFKKQFHCMSSVCSDATYIIEISFKDGKYKFDPISLKLSAGAGSFDVPLTDLKPYHDKKGELKKGSKEALDSIVNLFNSLQLSFDGYLTGKTKKEDW